MKASILKTPAALLLVLVASLTPVIGFAHTTATTTPKTGTVLAQSPPVIEITFAHEARLTSVVVVDTSKSERKLAFAPVGSAKVFTVSNPQLKPGRNEIQWKALSKDGHVVSGTLLLVIEPPAK